MEHWAEMFDTDWPKTLCMYITKEQKNLQSWGLGHFQD